MTAHNISLTVIMKKSVIILILSLVPTFLFAQSLQWSPTQGPYATVVNSFDSSAGVIYAGTNAGLYSSSAGGSLWKPVAAVTKLVATVMTSGGNIYVGGEGGCRISRDSGVTWIVRDTGFPLFAFVYGLTKFKNTLYAALGGDGLYQSTNDGVQWDHLNSGGIENKSITTMIAASNTLIAAEGAGVIRSIDNGFSWTESAGDIASQAVHTFARIGNTILAGTDAGVFISSDSGATWSASNTGMNAADIVTALCISGDGKSIFAGAINASSGVGIYRSVDDGRSWQLRNSGLTDLSVLSLFSVGTIVYAGTSLGISSTSNNGDSWAVSSTGLPKTPIVSLCADYHRVYAGSKGSYVFYSDDDGIRWQLSKYGLTRPNITALLGIGGGVVFAGTYAAPKVASGGLHRSTDHGTSWTQLTSGIPVMSVSFLTKWRSNIVACGDSGIYSSSDNGNAFTHLGNYVPSAISGDADTLLIAVKHSLFTYTDNTGWAPLEPAVVLPLIHACTKKGASYFIGTDSGIFRYQIGAAGMKLVSGDSIGVINMWSNDYLVAASTTKGIYLSSDNGNSWTLTQRASDTVMAFTAANKFLYAATSTGVIAAPLGEFGVGTTGVNNSLSLQCTNPAVGNALVRYTIPTRDHVLIEASDILGSRQSVLMNMLADPGQHDLYWNTSGLATGTYVIRMVCGTVQRTLLVVTIGSR